MSADVVSFPGMTPDYLAEIEREHPAAYERGVRQVHVSLLRGYAGNCAIDAANTDDPSQKLLWLNRERWFDEAASILEGLMPEDRFDASRSPVPTDAD